jgi:hypothetical protein
MRYLVTAFITALFVLLLLKIFEKDDNTQIKELKSYNDSLRISNNKLKSEIQVDLDNINFKDSLIKKLFVKQSKLYYVIDTLNNQIKNINEKYEKASKFSDSLNTYQLKRYFSELK